MHPSPFLWRSEVPSFEAIDAAKAERTPDQADWLARWRKIPAPPLAAASTGTGASGGAGST